MKVIISHVLGGIGNQMFQYAAGRALSLANGQHLLLDLSGFADYPLHNGYELNRVFDISAQCADKRAIEELLGWRANPIIQKILRRKYFTWLRGHKFVVEPHFEYWPRLSQLTQDCYLSGYWQSERYFKRFKETIRKDFTFREQLDSRNSKLAEQLLKNQSISLHVRRGDYISDPKTREILEACSISYYQSAIKYVAERVEQPTFFIFSDDMSWCKQNLSMKFPCVHVDHNVRMESYRDLQLMGMCKHHIIANSSFSWWGAWLNPSLEKFVVAPRRWFRDESDDHDLIPEEWTRL